MKIINYSIEPQNKLYSWLPRGLEAETVVFFPDAGPGKSPLPTGTVVYTKQADWRKFALSDVGCGMLLVKSSVLHEDFDEKVWDKIYFELKENKGKLGDLGSGNHFLDALISYDDNDPYLYFLIHTGSRKESSIVDDLTDDPVSFDKKFTEVIEWARQNRRAVASVLEKYFGELETIVDRNHNHFQMVDGGVVIRKGAVRVEEGELTVIPSNIEDDVVLVRATEKVKKVYNSLNHGTGWIMSRSKAKAFAVGYNYDALRENIYIPGMISNASIKTEAPFCYRNMDECLNLINELITIEKRFMPIAYLGQI